MSSADALRRAAPYIADKITRDILGGVSVDVRRELRESVSNALAVSVAGGNNSIVDQITNALLREHSYGSDLKDHHVMRRAVEAALTRSKDLH